MIEVEQGTSTKTQWLVTAIYDEKGQLSFERADCKAETARWQYSDDANPQVLDQ